MRIAAHLTGRIAYWALAGLALLVSHDTVFLAQTGPGERLAATLRTVGHGYWGAASAVLVAMAAIAAVFTLARLARLRRHAASLGAAQSARPARLLPIYIRLAAVVVIGFATQENVKHFIAHGHLIGAGALVGPEYPLALPVLGLVSFVAALGAALLVGRELEPLAVASPLSEPTMPVVSIPAGSSVRITCTVWARSGSWIASSRSRRPKALLFPTL